MSSHIQNNVTLKDFNTFGIDVNSKRFAKFSSAQELTNILDNSSAEDQEIMILGGGSNILLTKDYDGLVLKNEVPDITVVNENADHIYVKAGAGVNWHSFVLHCIDNEYAGIENLSLIPGNVGAAPMQNIGAYGVEIKDVFHELEAYDLASRKVFKLNGQECKFGYRESVFKNELKNKTAILNVTFKLDKVPTFKTSYGAIQSELERMGVDKLSIKAISDAVINIRQSKLPDPKVIGNAGSFFKNPVVSRKFGEELKEKFPAMVIYPVGDEHSKIASIER